jgi:hypothetical protein
MGMVLASSLFCHEVVWFLSAKGNSKMEVDLRRHRDLNINIDVTFHAVPCAGEGPAAAAAATVAAAMAAGVCMRAMRAQGPCGRGGPSRAPHAARRGPAPAAPPHLLPRALPAQP